MLRSLFSPKKRIANIIINDHSIRYLELKQENPPVASKWGEHILPAGLISNGKIQDYETLSMILEECLTDWKIRKCPVRFLIPESFVIIRKLTIPADVEDDEIKGYLYLELGASIHLPFDEPIFDAVVLSQDEEKKEVLVFAAHEDNVMDYVDLFSDLGLDPHQAEISPLAIYRLYYHLDQVRPNENLLIVQFNLTTVNISIFENDIPFFMHHVGIDFDRDKWEKRITRTGNDEFIYIGEPSDVHYQLEDIYKEINRLMDFYRYSLHQGQKQVTRILLDGDHPMIERIKSDLQERIDVPIDTILYEGSENMEQALSHTHYLALGLALKGV